MNEELMYRHETRDDLQSDTRYAPLEQTTCTEFGRDPLASASSDICVMSEVTTSHLADHDCRRFTSKCHSAQVDRITTVRSLFFVYSSVVCRRQRV